MKRYQCNCGRIITLYEEGEVFTHNPGNVNPNYCSNCGSLIPIYSIMDFYEEGKNCCEYTLEEDADMTMNDQAIKQIINELEKIHNYAPINPSNYGEKGWLDE